jgi:hypothetical protein
VARRIATTLVACCAAAALVPGTALGAKSFAGKTQQDRGIGLRVGDDGLVRSVRVNWRTRRCQASGAFLQDRTGFAPPFAPSTPDAFGRTRSYTRRQRGGLRIRITVTLKGQRLFDPANPAGEAWRGTVSASASVRRRGRAIDRCALTSIGWTATLTR